MDYRRIIPCLDTRDGQLVKGIHFVDLTDLGDPAEAGAAYSDAGADEIVVLDITATLEGRKTMLETVQRTVERIAVPLCVGGGIGSVGDIQALLDMGVSKVSMNSAAVKDSKRLPGAGAMISSARRQLKPAPAIWLPATRPTIRSRRSCTILSGARASPGWPAWPVAEHLARPPP